MRLALSLSAAAVGLVSLACAGLTSVPPPSPDYVGTWTNEGAGGETITLRITAEGQVEWERHSPGSDLSLAGPATSWTDGTLKCCLGFGSLTIEAPPEKGPEGWTMTVDGSLLTRP
ncbi:MAG: hypothetical protein KTR31_01900 [Myxococcales bacterium]|nr:hypothetical protein [Myxococcales bacterium]